MWFNLDSLVEVGRFRLVVFEVGTQAANLLLFIADGFVERLELLPNPLVSLLLRLELVASPLLRVQLLATLLCLRQSKGSNQSHDTCHVREFEWLCG